MLVDGPLRKRDRPKKAWMEIVRINKKKEREFKYNWNKALMMKWHICTKYQPIKVVIIRLEDFKESHI